MVISANGGIFSGEMSAREEKEVLNDIRGIYGKTANIPKGNDPKKKVKPEPQEDDGEFEEDDDFDISFDPDEDDEDYDDYEDDDYEDDEDYEDEDDSEDEEDEEDNEPVGKSKRKQEQKKPEDIAEEFWTGDESESYKKQAQAYKMEASEHRKRLDILNAKLGVQDDVDADLNMGYAEVDEEEQRDISEFTSQLRNLLVNGQISESQYHETLGMGKAQMKEYYSKRRKQVIEQTNNNVLLKVKNKYGSLIQSEPLIKDSAAFFLKRSIDAGEVLNIEAVDKMFDFGKTLLAEGEKRGREKLQKELKLRTKQDTSKQKLKSPTKKSTGLKEKSVDLTRVPQKEFNKMTDDQFFKNLVKFSQTQRVRTR